MYLERNSLETGEDNPCKRDGPKFCVTHTSQRLEARPQGKEAILSLEIDRMLASKNTGKK